MSYETSVFIKGPTAEKIFQFLRDRLDTHLTRGADASIAHVFGLTIAIVEVHGLEDDGGIRFTHYDLQVSFALYAGRLEPDTGRELCRSLARALASVVCLEMKAECLVVEELQRILGEFRSET